ncbi:MAG: enoyl-CoA hydratase family protein [Deltaproteobacteria bacterium]|nr:enoyl-CoA hydratase family protein [Deltaproteobacteria bacterium]
MTLALEIRDGVAELLLDHPPVNALDSAGWSKLAETLASLGRGGEARAVVLGAKGRGFCAGVDIKELAADSSRITRVNRACFDAFAAVHDCPVPVIAACHGFVLGGGIGLVGSCDIIVASHDASFGLPEIDRGALGAASHLMRMFPIQKVRKMLFTGEPIPAAEAYRLGAIEALVDRDELLPRARAIAASIAAKSPRAIRLAKECMNGIELLDVKTSYRFEQGFTLELYTSPDSQEARDAFVEKRGAKFQETK